MEQKSFGIGIVAGAAAILIAFALTLSPPSTAGSPPPLPPLSLELPDLSLSGFSAVSAEIRRPFIVLIKNQNASCNLTLSAVTDELQLSSIEKALSGEVDARANPHELLADTLKRFGIEAVMVRIDRLDGTVYLASLILRRGEQLLSLDARPSDAIAIALRTNTSTYIRDDLFEKNAKVECR